MEQVLTIGMMEENITVNGNKIKCMEKDILHGKMEEYIKVIILMIRNRDLENSYGQMVANFLVNGLMVNKKVQVFIIIKKMNKSMEFGPMEKE